MYLFVVIFFLEQGVFKSFLKSFIGSSDKPVSKAFSLFPPCRYYTKGACPSIMLCGKPLLLLVDGIA